MNKEAFLINPMKKKKRCKRKIKKLFSRNPLSELLLLNPKRKRKKVRFLFKQKSKKRGKKTMAKRRSLSVYKRKGGGVRISPKARLVKASRGRILNPIMKTSDLETIAGLSIGFVGARYIPRLIPQLNAFTGFPRIIAQTGSGLGLSFLISNILNKKELGRYVFFGTLLNTAVSVIDSFILRGVLSEEGIASLQDEQPIVISQGGEEYVEQLPDEYVSQLPDEQLVQLPDEQLVQLPDEQFAQTDEQFSETEQELVDISEEQPIIIT